jgi:hypothetical protein
MRGKLDESDKRNFQEMMSSMTYGTRLVWNSLRSTLRDPSKRRDAVIEDTTCAISLFKFEKLGEATARLFLQMS